MPPRRLLTLLLLAVVLAVAATHPSAPAQANDVVTLGATPNGVAVDPVAHRVYVANEDGASVSVVDAVSETVLATITLPQHSAPTGIAINPALGMLYVAESGARGLAFIDTSSLRVTGTLLVGPAPWAVAVNAASGMVYVSLLSNAVVVVDGNSNKLVATIQDATFARPDALAVDAAANRLYVANLDGSSVSVVDGSSNTVTGRLAAGGSPVALALDPTGQLLYVANYADASVWVIDTTGAAQAAEPTNGAPVALAVDALTGAVLVATRGNAVQVLDPAGTLLATMQSADLQAPEGIAIDDGLQTAFVTNGAGGSLSIISLATAGVPVAG